MFSLQEIEKLEPFYKEIAREMRGFQSYRSPSHERSFKAGMNYASKLLDALKQNSLGHKERLIYIERVQKFINEYANKSRHELTLDGYTVTLTIGEHAILDLISSYEVYKRVKEIEAYPSRVRHFKKREYNKLSKYIQGYENAKSEELNKFRLKFPYIECPKLDPHYRSHESLAHLYADLIQPKLLLLNESEERVQEFKSKLSETPLREEIKLQMQAMIKPTNVDDLFGGHPLAFQVLTNREVFESIYKIAAHFFAYYPRRLSCNLRMGWEAFTSACFPEFLVGERTYCNPSARSIKVEYVNFFLQFLNLKPIQVTY